MKVKGVGVELAVVVVARFGLGRPRADVVAVERGPVAGGSSGRDATVVDGLSVARAVLAGAA
jgi:hypothetical protein